jgi:hypothetical protein
MPASTRWKGLPPSQTRAGEQGYLTKGLPSAERAGLSGAYRQTGTFLGAILRDRVSYGESAVPATVAGDVAAALAEFAKAAGTITGVEVPGSSLVLRQGHQGIDRQEQGPGLVVGDVQHFDVHFQVGIQVATQMAVDQLEPAVRQLVGKQAAGKADLLIESGQGVLLQAGVQPKIPFVRYEVAGAHLGMSEVGTSGSGPGSFVFIMSLRP